jgi:hypothetical protein
LDEFGLINANARLYDPWLGQFISPDPLADQYPGLSPYSYCLNNPLNYVDPTGEVVFTSSDPKQIEAFITSYQSGQMYYDFSGWASFSDEEFSNMSDGFGIFLRVGGGGSGGTISFTTGSRFISPEGLHGVSLTLHTVYLPFLHAILNEGMHVYEPLSSVLDYINYILSGNRTYDDGKTIWSVNMNGDIVGPRPITGTPPIPSLPGLKALNIAKSANKLAKLAKSSKAVKVGMETKTPFSGKTIDNAVNLVMNDANKLNHLFLAKHNLRGLVSQLGGKENTIRAILNAANGKLPVSGAFNNISVTIGGQTVFIRGSVINGIPRLGTMYIP